LGYFGVPLWLWAIAIVVALWGLAASVGVVSAAIVVLAIFVLPPIRRVLVTSFVMKFMKKILPRISDTERVALNAGVVWSEAELFSGKPNFTKLMSEPYPQLTAEEQAFLDGPVEKLCSMIHDFDIWKNRELPPEAFQYMKDQGFLGMIIPKQYGGLGFTAMCNSEVVQKVSTRSITAGVTIMVRNSLGPAE